MTAACDRWDNRQQMMEHETFFLKLVVAGHRVGFDPSVTIRHLRAASSSEYIATSLRYREARFLQYLCRNFPRVSTWSLPFVFVDCLQSSYTPKWDSERRVRVFGRDTSDDSSTVPHKPPPLACFVLIPSAPGPNHTAQRDQLRQTWLRHLNAAQDWD